MLTVRTLLTCSREAHHLQYTSRFPWSPRQPAVEVLLSCYPRETRSFLRKNPRLLLLLTLRSQLASRTATSQTASSMLMNVALSEGDKLLEPALERIVDYVTVSVEGRHCIELVQLNSDHATTLPSSHDRKLAR